MSLQTALTLTMAIYKLSQHHDVLRRLREEILTQVGMRRPTYDDIKDLKYLRAFVNGKVAGHLASIICAEAVSRGFALVSRRVSIIISSYRQSDLTVIC